VTAAPAPWVDAGPLDDVPDGGCAAAVDDRVLLIRNGDEVAAYDNRCLHKDTPLHEGYITAGTLACPLHFWRYDLRDGHVIGGTGALPRYPAEVVDGRIRVAVPPPAPSSIADLLRAHATTWSRDDDPGGTARPDRPTPRTQA
jgi:nitrite reductase (NADH) small subunit